MGRAGFGGYSENIPRSEVAARLATILRQCKAGLDAARRSRGCSRSLARADRCKSFFCCAIGIGLIAVGLRKLGVEGMFDGLYLFLAAEARVGEIDSACLIAGYDTKWAFTIPHAVDGFRDRRAGCGCFEYGIIIFRPECLRGRTIVGPAILALREIAFAGSSGLGLQEVAVGAWQVSGGYGFHRLNGRLSGLLLDIGGRCIGTSRSAEQYRSQY